MHERGPIDDGTPELRGRVPGHILGLCAGLSLFAGVVFFFAFFGVSHIALINDAAGEADGASYHMLLTEWDPSRVYGDAYSPHPRKESAVAQEHKIKHVLYPLLFAPFAQALIWIGVPPLEASRLSSVVCGMATVALFVLLLWRTGQRAGVIVPITLILIASPSMWVYHSIPESWPLTGLLLLAGVHLHLQYPFAVWRTAVMAGAGMLCNIILGFLILLPAVERLWKDGPVQMGKTVVAGAALALMVFCSSLTALSAFAPELRPDRVMEFMLFFRGVLTHAGEPLTMGAVKGTVSQLAIVPFSSLQPGVDLTGPWGAGFTIDYSTAGAMAVGWIVLVWAGFLLAVMGRVFRDGWRHLAHGWEIKVSLLLFLVVAFLHMGHYPSMLLYSSALLPLFIAVAVSLISPVSKRSIVVLWVTSAVVAYVSVQQCWLLRDPVNAPAI